jgi:putative transposase
MPQSYVNLQYHLIFATKDRHRWMLPEIRPRLYDYLGGAIRDEGGKTLAIGGVEDHLHILAALRQDKAISRVRGSIKANSSGWIHRTFPNLWMFDWQDGYGAFTVSRSLVPAVSRYIARQEEHHRRVSFEEEFRALLRAHGIDWDERYFLK